MRGKLTLYLDQYGNRFFARTVAELRSKIGGGRVSRMYADKNDGRTAPGMVAGSTCWNVSVIITEDGRAAREAYWSPAPAKENEA